MRRLIIRVIIMPIASSRCLASVLMILMVPQRFLVADATSISTTCTMLPGSVGMTSASVLMKLPSSPCCPLVTEATYLYSLRKGLWRVVPLALLAMPPADILRHASVFAQLSVTLIRIDTTVEAPRPWRHLRLGVYRTSPTSLQNTKTKPSNPQETRKAGRQASKQAGV